ncbi:MAG: hypothetical protein ABL904_23450 [Hyphomicrobiaceae bacterium]
MAVPLPTIAVMAVPTTYAPAVAGFVHRFVPPVDFQLSARLASVAHLNTKIGRIPRTTCPPQPNAKAIPKSTGSNRKRSKLHMSTNSITAARAVKAQKSAKLFQLPAPQSRRIPLEIRIAQAA